jgi:hypothetical protein
MPNNLLIDGAATAHAFLADLVTSVTSVTNTLASLTSLGLSL